MTRGRGIKCSWGDRGGMSRKGRGGYQQLLNTSQVDISEPSSSTSQQNTFTNIIKEKVGETSTLSNEAGLEVDDGDMERNTATNGEEEGGKTSKDNDVTLLKTISEEQLLNTWIQTVGETTKRKNIWS